MAHLQLGTRRRQQAEPLLLSPLGLALRDLSGPRFAHFPQIEGSVLKDALLLK